jgi:hypothetical protein
LESLVSSVSGFLDRSMAYVSDALTFDVKQRWEETYKDATTTMTASNSTNLLYLYGQIFIKAGRKQQVSNLFEKMPKEIKDLAKVALDALDRSDAQKVVEPLEQHTGEEPRFPATGDTTLTQEEVRKLVQERIQNPVRPGVRPPAPTWTAQFVNAALDTVMQWESVQTFIVKPFSHFFIDSLKFVAYTHLVRIGAALRPSTFQAAQQYSAFRQLLSIQYVFETNILGSRLQNGDLPLSRRISRLQNSFARMQAHYQIDLEYEFGRIDLLVYGMQQLGRLRENEHADTWTKWLIGASMAAFFAAGATWANDWYSEAQIKAPPSVGGAYEGYDEIAAQINDLKLYRASKDDPARYKLARRYYTGASTRAMFNVGMPIIHVGQYIVYHLIKHVTSRPSYGDSIRAFIFQTLIILVGASYITPGLILLLFAALTVIVVGAAALTGLTGGAAALLLAKAIGMAPGNIFSWAIWSPYLAYQGFCLAHMVAGQSFTISTILPYVYPVSLVLAIFQDVIIDAAVSMTKVAEQRGEHKLLSTADWLKGKAYSLFTSLGMMTTFRYNNTKPWAEFRDELNRRRLMNLDNYIHYQVGRSQYSQKGQKAMADVNADLYDGFYSGAEAAEIPADMQQQPGSFKWQGTGSRATSAAGAGAGAAPAGGAGAPRPRERPPGEFDPDEPVSRKYNAYQGNVGGETSTVAGRRVNFRILPTTSSTLRDTQTLMQAAFGMVDTTEETIYIESSARVEEMTSDRDDLIDEFHDRIQQTLAAAPTLLGYPQDG